MDQPELKTQQLRDIQSLSQTCDCINRLTHDMLQFAVEEHLYDVENSIESLKERIQKYPAMAKRRVAIGLPWEEALKQKEIEKEMYHILANELRKVKICS